MSRARAAFPFLVILAAVVLVIVLLSTGGEDKPKPAVVTVAVDGLDAGTKPDRTIVVPKAAVDQAARGLTGTAAKQVPDVSEASADHTGARDETPAGLPAPLLAANLAALDRNRRTTNALPTAGASGGAPGCVTAFVRNQSSRRGVRPTVQVLHYTVSPNRPGRSDVNGITAFFDRASTAASSNFVIDAEGNCNYIVPIEAKAWTQAGGNPWAVSYEIIATGREKTYLPPAGLNKLRSVMRWVSGKTGIPMYPGHVGGCVPTRKGIVQHADGGTCWGGHHDIGPFSATTVVAQLIRGSGCSRACDLRKRNTATHAELKRRSCAPADKTKSARCTLLHRRHRALHAAAAKARGR